MISQCFFKRRSVSEIAETTKFGKNPIYATSLFVVMAMLFSFSARADEALSAEQISTAVSDRTYQGSMTDNAFAEYYAPDGSIRGKGYSGKWRTEDGTMCFQYGDSPEKCWQVLINGPALTLIKEGKVDGSGMLVDGNPQAF